MTKKDLPFTVLNEDQTSLRPPGQPGSLMDRLVAAGTHKILRPQPGLIMVVPITAPANEAIVVIKKKPDNE